MFKVCLYLIIFQLNISLTAAVTPMAVMKNKTRGNTTDTTGVDYLNRMCWSLRKTNPIKAIAIGNRSLDLAEVTGDNNGKAQVLNYLGICYFYLNDSGTASSYFFRALAFSDSLNINIQKGYALNNIASSLMQAEEYEQALSYTYRSLRLQNKNNNRQGVAYAWLRMSDAYCRINHYDSLLISAKKAYKLLTELKMKDNALLALKNIAMGWEGKKEYDNALTCYLEILKADTTVANNYANIARVYNLLNLPDHAIHYGKKWLNSRNGNALVLKHLSDSYAMKLEWKEAYRYARLSRIVMDSLARVEKVAQIKNMQMLNKTRATELENAGLKMKLNVKNLYLIILAIIVVSIGLLFTIHLGKRRQLVHLNKILNQKNEENCRQRDYLEEINQTKNKLFSIIAHDLRGPIGSTSAFLELLTTQGSQFTKEELLDNLMLLKNSSDATFKLLENLLTWALTQRGEIEFNPSKNDMAKLVQSNIDLFTSNAENKKIQIVNQPNHPLIFEFDQEMINTVIRNLINNAIKYTGENGQITISAFESHHGIEISVSDTGIGIDDDTVKQLFVSDLNRTTKQGTKGEKGTGLGLILCKEFVEKHSGKIWVESEHGKGSTFKIILPRKHSIKHLADELIASN